jgi:hypothetical protein
MAIAISPSKFKQFQAHIFSVGWAGRPLYFLESNLIFKQYKNIPREGIMTNSFNWDF